MSKKTRPFAAAAAALVSAVLALLLVCTVSSADRLAATIIVTSPGDNGQGTLRRALLDAQPGDTITFDATVFPPAAPVTITLTTPLPALVQGNLTLDASSAGVVLDGFQLSGDDTHGLDVSSDGNVVRGLEIRNFPGAAVGLREGTRDNVVEDNLLSGNGSFGVAIWGAETVSNTIQGNRIGINRDGHTAGGLTRDGIHVYRASQNTITDNLIAGVGQSGIYICCSGTGNIVSNNTIGLAADGSTPLPNGQAGITIDQGAHDTVVGPGNVIAHNPVGVNVIGADSLGNTITQNRIYSNTEGISLVEGGNGEPTLPTVIGFDLSAGTIEGAACAHCTVEVFSTAGDQGDVYEGQTASDSVGTFTLDAGGRFDGPHLTATATDAAGNTSGFSRPTSGERQGVDLQTGNTHPKSLIQTRPGRTLMDNKTGPMISLGASIDSERAAQDYLRFMDEIGFTWVRLSLDCFDWSEVVEGECGHSRAHVDGVDPIHDQLITDLSGRGITILYGLVFWDKDIVDPGTTGYSRFKTQEEIDRYLDYADFIVDHFKGRIRYYEILNETFFGEDSDFTQQNIALDDYINLVDQVIPVIKAADPDAKVVAGPAPAVYDQACYDYQLGILSSDLIMPEADAVSWHPGPYPVTLGGPISYLYEVPKTVDEIRGVASAHGFTGEYIPEEIQWPTAYNPSTSEPWNVYSETISAKYFGRGILDHRGLGLPALLAGTASEGNLPKMDVIRNLANLLAGAEAAPLPLHVQSTLTDVVSCTFAYEGGDSYLAALWEGGFATNEIEPGTPLTLTVPGFTTTLQMSADSDLSVIGYDVLHNFRQPLDAYVDGDSLVIPALQVRDYPLVLRLTQIKPVFLPTVLRSTR